MIEESVVHQQQRRRVGPNLAGGRSAASVFCDREMFWCNSGGCIYICCVFELYDCVFELFS